MNSRRDSQFHEGAEVMKCVRVRVRVVCMWMCVDMCFGLALHCKSKSSDDIINTVSESDGGKRGGAPDNINGSII